MDLRPVDPIPLLSTASARRRRRATPPEQPFAIHRPLHGVTQLRPGTGRLRQADPAARKSRMLGARPGAPAMPHDYDPDDNFGQAFDPDADIDEEAAAEALVWQLLLLIN